MLCVLILYISGGTYSLKSTPNDRFFFFEKLFMEILFTLRVFARNQLRRNRRRNTFRISFWCLAWGSNPGFSSNKPTHYLLDYGDFIHGLNFLLGDDSSSDFYNGICLGVRKTSLFSSSWNILLSYFLVLWYLMQVSLLGLLC